MTRRILTVLLLVFAALLCVPMTRAQDLTITNLQQLSQVAFSANYSLYLPWTPWQWRAYSTDNGEPWWVDCSQVTCADLLSTSTNACATLQMHGVTVTSVVLAKNVLTGETLLYSGCSTDVIASVAAPSGYEPGTLLGENAWVWREWQQVTNCLDCWGLTADEIPPPIVTLKTRLADAALYSTYASNEEVDAAAAAAAWASSASSFTTSGRFTSMLMDDDSCTITDESSAFWVTDIAQDTNGYTTVTWMSCSDHIYGVFSADALSTNTQWTGQAAMWGDDGMTSWTDTTTSGVTNRFYKVVRIPPDEGYNGDPIPSGWAVDNGLNPLDPNLDVEDPDGDSYNNLDEFLMGTNPNATNDPITVYVDSMNTNGVWDGTQAHPFRYIQDAIECSVPVTSNLAIRVRPGKYYETVSNQQYDFNGDVLASRKYLYIYAANTNWSLSADPESHLIDSSGSPNGDVLGNPAFDSTPASTVEFFDVDQARINGFTIRDGAGAYGGGIVAYSSTNGPIYISNCIVEENGGTGASEAGGIFLQAGTNSLIYNTVVSKNAGAAGGIIDIYGSRIWNCTVVSNVNVQTDVGAISGDVGMPSVRNCAVWGNGLDLLFVDADYSTFGSNESVSAGTHNLSVDPILVNTANGNYRLQTNSTVRGAGTSLPIEQQDLYGNPRPVTGSFDIGANQYTDSLGSGMQDDWEIKNGLSLSVNQGASDFDGDGLSNLQEYNNNTNPNNPDTDGDGISDGPTVPPGSGLQPGPDPNPITPNEVITGEFHASQRQAVWQYYVDGATDPSWVNEPPTQPRWLKFNNYHIGDRFNIQMKYLSGPTNDTMFFLVALQSTGASSVLPDVNATPLLHFTDSAQLGQLTPPGGWTTTVWQATLTNFEGVCAGFDDETPKFFNLTHDALSVPQNGTNTVSAVIFPTNLYPQVTFDTLDSFVTVTPAQAGSATQLLQVAGSSTGTNIVSSIIRVLGYGAQNSWTNVGTTADVDVLPKKTNVVVALYRVTASSTPTISSTNVPSASELKTYLDGLYGKQANVFMTVLAVTNVTVNYDLNGNTNLDWAVGLSSEQRAITGAVYNVNAINIYYVKAIFNSLQPNVIAVADPGTKTCWVGEVTVNSNVNITAHEMGHVFGLNHPNNPGQPLTGDPDRLMWEGADGSNPCRLIRSEWQTVNKAAK